MVNIDDDINTLGKVFDNTCKITFNEYARHVKAYCSWQEVDNEDPDEIFMREIELEINISEDAKKVFREEIFIRVSANERRGKVFSIDSHKKLKEAVENFVWIHLKKYSMKQKEIHSLSAVAKEISDSLEKGEVETAKSLIDELHNGLNKIKE